MRVPYDTNHMTGGELIRLLNGVKLYEGSLTGEYVMATTAPSQSNGSSRLSWHGWNQQTHLLAMLFNQLEKVLAVTAATKDGNGYKPQFLLPPAVQHADTSEHVVDSADEFASFFMR